jgi:hypothetical protein
MALCVDNVALAAIDKINVTSNMPVKRKIIEPDGV